MFSRSTLVPVLLLSMAGASRAQTLAVPGNPVPPGAAFPVVLTNNTAQLLPVSAAPLLHLLQPGGELVVPDLVGCLPVGIGMAPGGTMNLSFTPPADGPGSAGSFVLLFPYGNGAVARVDVGAASAGFPDIHTYPANTPFNAVGHHVVFPPSQSPDWEIANTGAAAHTFAGGQLDVLAPGGTTPLASLALSGITVPAGGVTRLALPLSGLTPGPYTVQVQWTDPAAGAQVVRHGIEASATTGVDLHLPGGRLVPLGGSIPARLAMRGFAVSGGMPPASEPLVYALVLGFAPGTTPLPGGGILPLALDPLVSASAHNGVAGILTDHLGFAADSIGYCAHRNFAVPSAKGIEIHHLNLPVLSGVTLRAAGLVVNLQGATAASQPEDITFQ